MIYLDNAATTLQKPSAVAKAMEQALYTCANPGRSGHRPAMKAAEAVYECRRAAAELFGLDAPERVVFTLNATHALNLAIKSLLHEGGHAVISGYEHNSVVRPLEAMAERGVSYTAAVSPLFRPELVCPAIERAITPQTRCVIVTHVSNVFGFVLPLAEIDALCRKKGLPLVVDASQSAGLLPLDDLKDVSNGAVQVIGADPEGSIYSDPNDVHQYQIEGVGEDFYPKAFDRSLPDEIVQVTDAEAFEMTRRLANEEGLLVGGSSGMAVFSALKYAREHDLDENQLVVVLMPDSGRSYMEKIFNDDWMRANGFADVVERTTKPSLAEQYL